MDLSATHAGVHFWCLFGLEKECQAWLAGLPPPVLPSYVTDNIVRTEIWERALFKEFQAFWGKSGLPTVLA